MKFLAKSEVRSNRFSTLKKSITTSWFKKATMGKWKKWMDGMTTPIVSKSLLVLLIPDMKFFISFRDSEFWNLIQNSTSKLSKNWQKILEILLTMLWFLYSVTCSHNLPIDNICFHSVVGLKKVCREVSKFLRIF